MSYEEALRIAAAMVVPVRCGGLDYDDKGPFYWMGGQKVRKGA